MQADNPNGSGPDAARKDHPGAVRRDDFGGVVDTHKVGPEGTHPLPGVDARREAVTQQLRDHKGGLDGQDQAGQVGTLLQMATLQEDLPALDAACAGRLQIPADLEEARTQGLAAAHNLRQRALDTATRTGMPKLEGAAQTALALSCGKQGDLNGTVGRAAAAERLSWSQASIQDTWRSIGALRLQLFEVIQDQGNFPVEVGMAARGALRDAQLRAALPAAEQARLHRAELRFGLQAGEYQWDGIAERAADRILTRFVREGALGEAAGTALVIGQTVPDHQVAGKWLRRAERCADLAHDAGLKGRVSLSQARLLASSPAAQREVRRWTIRSSMEEARTSLDQAGDPLAAVVSHWTPDQAPPDSLLKLTDLWDLRDRPAARHG